MERKDTEDWICPKTRDVLLFPSMRQMMAQTEVRFYPFYLTNEIPTDNNESNFSKYKCDTVLNKPHCSVPINRFFKTS